MSTFKKSMDNALQRRHNLSQYIGKEYNLTIKTEIETIFSPYIVILCDMEYYYLEICLINMIRCVVEDGTITNICFN